MTKSVIFTPLPSFALDSGFFLGAALNYPLQLIMRGGTPGHNEVVAPGALRDRKTVHGVRVEKGEPQPSFTASEDKKTHDTFAFLPE